MALGQANRGSSLRFVYTSPGPRQVHLKGLLNWGQWKQDSWIGLATSELNGHTFFSKWKALIPLGNWRQCLVWQVKQSLMGSVEVSEGSRHRVCRRLCSGTGRTLEPDDQAPVSVLPLTVRPGASVPLLATQYLYSNMLIFLHETYTFHTEWEKAS